MKLTWIAAALATICAMPALAGGDTPSKPGTKEYIVSPQDGDTVTSPVTVIFGLDGMGIAPAGVEKEGTGHHHLLLDRAPFGEGEAGEMDMAIPADEHNIHYGGGQTQTTLELEPGEHTLQLVLGDYSHVPLTPEVMSDVVTITVE